MTEEALKEAANTVETLRGNYLFDDETMPDIDAAPLVAHHFIAALAHLELAVQEFRIARLHYIKEQAHKQA